MILDDLLRLAVSEILFHRIQSLLIIASIAVGVFAIFTLNSVGMGLKEEFTEITGKMGADIAIITAGSIYSFQTSINEQDLRVIQAIPSVREACPIKFNVAVINGEMYWTIGMTTACYQWLRENGVYELERGDFGMAAGSIMAKNLELDVNSAVEVEDQKFRITGILKPVGSEQDDSSLYMTLADFDKVYGETDYYMVYIQFLGDPQNLEQAVDNAFRDKDVEVTVMEQMMEQVTGMLDTLNIALTGVAFISVLVGAITIANTVYATIKRRTREVGMLKAVGAENNEVLVMFLFETLILSSLGGVVGIGIGYLVAKLVADIVTQAFVTFQPSVNPWLIGGSMLLAMLVGPLSALAPALYAAKLSPTEALRYE